MFAFSQLAPRLFMLHLLDLDSQRPMHEECLRHLWGLFNLHIPPSPHPFHFLCTRLLSGKKPGHLSYRISRSLDLLAILMVSLNMFCWPLDFFKAVSRWHSGLVYFLWVCICISTDLDNHRLHLEVGHSLGGKTPGDFLKREWQAEGGVLKDVSSISDARR